MKKSKYIFVLLLLISISVVCTCGTFFYVKVNNGSVSKAGSGVGGADASTEEFVIMTSCNPVYLAAINVAGDIDGVTVENLSQPTTGCLHDYTLTTQDMINLSRADVLIVNGGGMEGYLDDVIKAYPELPIIDTFEYIEHDTDLFDYLDMEEDDHEEEEHAHEEHEEGHHHDHGVNSHIWMSDLLYFGQVKAIADGLENIDEAHKDLYVQNALNYEKVLSSQIDKQGLDESLAGANVAILHEAFAYTAESVGANVVAVMDLDEERQVSAGEVGEFIEAIKENDVKVVFAEYDYGNAMGNLITEQTDAKVVYLETLVHGEYDGLEYIEVVNKNYALIKNSL